MWHRTDNFIAVCGKWIFDSNFEVAFPLTQYCLNFTCRVNDTDENKFVDVLHVIRSVPPEVVQIIKYEIRVSNYHHSSNHHYLHCSNFHLPHIRHG